MVQKPMVGIIAKPLTEFECPGDVWTEDYVKDEFRAAVCRAGGIALGILPPFGDERYNPDESPRVMRCNLDEGELLDFEHVLSLCDGIVLQGGMTADYYEYHAACYALEHDLPVLGVCAGFNTLCRAAGSDIANDRALGLDPALHNVYSTEYRHEVRLVGGGLLTDLFGRDSLQVNSLHTQFFTAGAAQANPRIKVGAVAENVTVDGSSLTTVEAFSVQGARFALGVKWHPELMDAEHCDRIFSRFVDACRARCAERAVL